MEIALIIHIYNSSVSFQFCLLVVMPVHKKNVDDQIDE